MFSDPLKCSDGRYGSRMQRLGSGEGGLQQARSSPTFKQSPPRVGDIESNRHTTGFYTRDKGRAARDSNVFGGIIGAPIVHPGTALPWLSDSAIDQDNRQSAPKAYPGGPICATSVALQENSKRRSLVETLFPAHAGGRAGISGPILRDGGFAEPSSGISNPGAMPTTTNPFPKVRTVSLRVAKEAERQRIDAQFERDQKKLQEAAATAGSNAAPMTSKSIPATPKSGGGVERTTSVKRKPVFSNDTPGLSSGPAPRVSAVVGKRGPQRNRETEIGPEIESKSPSTLRESVLAGADDATWGAMRYSTNTFVTDDDDTTRYTAFSNSPHPLRAPPREAGSRKADKSIDGEAKVLFINEIVYDHPALVDSLVRGPDAQEDKKGIGLTTSRYSGISNGSTVRRSPSSTKRPQLPTTQEVDEIPPVPKISASVMDRPRHIRKNSGRGIFPPARDSEIALEMKLKKSVDTSKSLPLRPPPTDPLPPLPVQSEEIPVPATAPAEVLVEKRVEKKPTKLIFPIPPSGAPSTRKLAPPPIAIEPLGLVLPEVVRKTPSLLPAELKIRPQEERLPVAPNIPERSESRTSIISPIPKDGTDSATVSDAAYEAARAWIASVASIRMSTGAPVLANIEGGHQASHPKNSDTDSLTIKPSPGFACDEGSSGFGGGGVPSFTSSTILRKSVLSFIISPKVTHGDGDVTDVEIDSDSEVEDAEESYEGNRDSSSDTEMTQSEAGEMIGAGGEGYSTEDDEEDEEYLTESDPQEFTDHRDEVVISGVDDGTEFRKIEMTERKLNAKMSAIADAIPNMSAFPRRFNIGDHIPAFSESRGEYGSKRKPPPSPLGFLMCQRRVSRQPSDLQQGRIQARLTILAEDVSRNVAALDDLLAKIPAEAKSSRNTQNGLWNSKGSIATLTETKTPLRNASALWTRHGKYAKSVFGDLSLVSSRSKRQLSARPLVSVHGALWIASISSLTDHKNSDDIRGLWNSRRAVDQEISETPPPVTSAQKEESPASPIRAYKHNLLWQPGDGPTQPAHSPIPPVTLSKSNKRHEDSPLFLALPPATGSMWTAPASKSNPCPPRLWTPSSVTLRGLWSFNNKTPSLAVLTRKNSPLWSKHNTANPIFSTLPTESRRTFPARPDVTASMEGPLWTPSSVETQQPRLWKPSKKTEERLWTAEGTTPPLSQIADLKAGETPLWSKENSIIAPIFSDLSLNSLRSKKTILTKNLPVVEEGLWTKRIDLPQISRVTTGLWGTIDELPKVQATPKRAPMLWNKEGIIAPIFAHLPTDSVRSKKDTSSITLPVFTEPMWKKEVLLKAKPELWRPTPKPTGLWDVTAKTKTLAQMSLEKKAKSSPLWKKEGARRTTNAMPTRTNTAVRLPDKTAPPKAVGGLWKPKIAAKPAPQLWARRKSMKVEKQPVGVLLWARETASRTTEATPERTKVSFAPSDSPLPKVSGNLWQKETPEGPKGLWKPPLKTVSSAALQPSTPLWSREKASKRTAAVPERLTLVPKKLFLVQTDPPKASGALWKPKAQAAPNGLWVKPAVITTKPIAIRTVLWTAASASRTTSTAPARSTVPKRVIEEPLPTVSGKMWQKETPEKPKGLWRREIKTVGAFRKTSNTPLWSREGAARTTTAIPERAPFVPKPASMKPLEPALGDLWQPELAEKEAITLWKQKPVVPRVGVWNAEGTTPSLAEIKRELATKDTLWQRRSILAARGANEDIFNNRSSFIQKKLIMDPIHLDTTQSRLWKPTEGSADDDETSWRITNTPPTGTLSCTSTLSDISEISPTTSAVGAYEPRVRTHSKNSSISSTSGLWQPLSNCSSSKKVGLWSNDETPVPFVNLICDTRTERTPLPTQREEPLKTFYSSHNLRQPEILCDPKVKSPPWCWIVPYLMQLP